jgi:hypothetical protein
MIKLVKTPISIRKIACDDWMTIIKAGWSNSRPNAQDIDFFEVLKIDTPVSELAGFVAEFTVPILFREIICSARDHIVWARTSRVDNLTEEWSIVEDVDNLQPIEALAKFLLAESKIKPQDVFRQNLPLSYMTSFTTRMSIRSALKMIKYFEYISTFGGEATQSAHKFAGMLQLLLIEQGIPVLDLLPILKMDEYCPVTRREDAGSYFIETPDHLIIEGNYSIMLRSQIIRHRLLHVVDDLSCFLTEHDVWSTPISHKMHMSIGATRQTWKSIISKRMCWLAHSSIWSDIINDVSRVDNHSIETLIPCSDGICPYNEDCKQRIVKNDPGLPCPRQIAIGDKLNATMTKKNFDKAKLLTNMNDYVVFSNRPIDYWAKEIINCAEKLEETDDDHV